MKKPLLTMFLAIISPYLFAQGTILFNNLGPGVDAPVTNWNGTPLAGWMFAADLWWAPGIVTDPNMLVELQQPAAFYSEGYFLGGTRTIPGTSPGTIITVQVRVLGGAPGCPPFCFDCYCPTFQTGQSELIQVRVATPPEPPTGLTGLPPFGLSPPTTYSAPQFFLNTVAGDKFVLTWQPSVTATNFVVQQNADLATRNWVTLAQRPRLVGSQFQIEIPKPTGTMFYRLVSQ